MERGYLPKKKLGRGFKLLGEDLLVFMGSASIAGMRPEK